jgi:hypothetical protein
MADMSFEEWQNRNGKFGAKTYRELMSEPVTSIIDLKLRKAVAYYLYIESKDVEDEKGGLYRAAALALMNKPVDPALLAEASAKKSNDDPLYSADYGTDPMLSDVWEYHHRTDKPPSSAA